MSSLAPATSQPGLHGADRRWAVCAILCGLSMCVLDTTMLNLALPTISQALQIDPAQALWIVNAGQIIPLMVLLPLSALGDRLGYRRIYLSGIALFGLASVLAALAPSLPWLVTGRGLQGLGVAAVLSVNTALVRQIYPPALLGRGIALNSMVTAISTVSGPLLAAAVLSASPSWRMLFTLHLPAALGVLLLGLRYLPRSTPSAATQRPAWSWIDVLLNMGLFGGIFLALDRLSHSGQAMDGPWLLIWLVVASLCGVLYVRRQRPLTQPMLPLDLMAMHVYRCSMGSSAFAFSAQTMAFLALPFFMAQYFGLSLAQTGMVLTAWPIALALTAPWVGRAIGRTSSARLAGCGMLVLALGLGLLAAMPPDAGWVAMAWRLALCGAGFALFQAPNNHTFVSAAPRSRSGAASGLMGSSRHAGQCLGALSLSATFIWAGSSAAATALWLACAWALLSALCSSLRRHTDSHA